MVLFYNHAAATDGFREASLVLADTLRERFHAAPLDGQNSRRNVSVALGIPEAGKTDPRSSDTKSIQVRFGIEAGAYTGRTIYGQKGPGIYGMTMGLRDIQKIESIGSRVENPSADEMRTFFAEVVETVAEGTGHSSKEIVAAMQAHCVNKGQKYPAYLPKG